MLCLRGEELAHTGPGPVIVSIGFSPAPTTTATEWSTADQLYPGALGSDASNPLGLCVLRPSGAISHQCAWTRTDLTPSWLHWAAANGPSMLPESSSRSSSMSVSSSAARAG